MAAIVLMLVVVLNACGMQARKDNKPIQTEKLENVNQNKTLESEKSEGAASTDKKTKEVYNCCGFITDTGVFTTEDYLSSVKKKGKKEKFKLPKADFYYIKDTK